MIGKNLIERDFINIKWFQRELIERKFDGEIRENDIKVWYEILAKWRREHEND